jgi:hypothetical protein
LNIARPSWSGVFALISQTDPPPTSDKVFAEPILTIKIHPVRCCNCEIRGHAGHGFQFSVPRRPLDFEFSFLGLFPATIGGVLGLVIAGLTANAMLDKSPVQTADVEFAEMVEVTHSFLFREYKLKYQRVGKKEDKEFLTTPQHLAQFDTLRGRAHIRGGRFGWPWVETIEPVNGANGGQGR